MNPFLWLEMWMVVVLEVGEGVPYGGMFRRDKFM